MQLLALDIILSQELFIIVLHLWFVTLHYGIINTHHAQFPWIVKSIENYCKRSEPVNLTGPFGGKGPIRFTNFWIPNFHLVQIIYTVRPFLWFPNTPPTTIFCLVISSIQLGTRKKFPFKQPVIKLRREHVYTIRTVKANQEKESALKISYWDRQPFTSAVPSSKMVLVGCRAL